jgi:glucose-1-phosphate thymidylyltransferase
VVRGAEIEHSIVLENSHIENVDGKIDSSLLGKNCVVQRSLARPNALKLMLGDHSKVELL